MIEERHDPLNCVEQLSQTLAADKLAIGFFLGAGCPCGVLVPSGESDKAPIIPDIKGLTKRVNETISNSKAKLAAYAKLMETFSIDNIGAPSVEHMLNRIRSFREVAGSAEVRGLSRIELDGLDAAICKCIRDVVNCPLPLQRTPYHALANFIGRHQSLFVEVFTTNYDILMEQAFESERVPYFDGFIGASKPFFDQRAIEDDVIPPRWSRLWKLHGSVNWKFNKGTKAIFRDANEVDGGELLIHPSHLKYDESRRMPYYVMIDRLRSFLRRDGRPVALFICGYSFGDEHINETIVEGLKANPSAACFALQYGELADHSAAMAFAKDNANLSVLASDRAVIRRREAPWVARASTDLRALQGVFEVTGAPDESANHVSEEAELSQCRLVIGDFRRFGEYLDEFSGRTSSGNGAN